MGRYLEKKMRTMFQKIWDSHVVRASETEATILYIDTHLVHEVTSPQAFEGLRLSGRRVRRPDRTFATMDHNVPTTDRTLPITDLIAKKQMDTLAQNCQEFGITLYDLDSPKQGIVHVIGPELGITQPGMTIVCGDSHTSTHGAFGALAFGIGTSETEHVLATQCLLQRKPKTLEIRIDGQIPYGVTAKDIILTIIGQIGTDGGTGSVIEFTGSTIESLDMEERMTVCNMTIEAGARAGMIAPDDKTYQYLSGLEFSPNGTDFERTVETRKQLPTDEGATYNHSISIPAEKLQPQVTWGTSPEMVLDVTAQIPDPDDMPTTDEKRATGRALEYMGLIPGTPISEIEIDKAFIGSCTNSRISDLRKAAEITKGHQVNNRVHAIVVPGSKAVKRQAEAEGLDQIFKSAGFEWREAGCSMCLAMNPDKLQPGERCASTSNRNFEGRQGKGSRTHLVSPQMAAAAAIQGKFVDIRTWSK